MVKYAFITFSLFSATICFSQNIDNNIKEISKSPLKSESEEKVKPSLKEEYTGTKPNPINPDSLQVIMYNPSNETTDKKSSSSDKNSSKPH